MARGWRGESARSVRVRYDDKMLVYHPTLYFYSGHFLDKEIISVLLNIGQKVKRPWPFLVLNHRSKINKIYLRPGQMVFYEGSK